MTSRSEELDGREVVEAGMDFIGLIVDLVLLFVGSL